MLAGFFLGPASVPPGTGTGPQVPTTATGTGSPDPDGTTPSGTTGTPSAPTTGSPTFPVPDGRGPAFPTALGEQPTSLPPGFDPAAVPPATVSVARHPAYGLCPGAPGEKGGMKRNPDTARDAAGELHMVWQERFDGRFDICYASQPGELGLGSDANPAFRITQPPFDSVAPRIAIDAASGIGYVVWTEILPGDGVAESPGSPRAVALLRYTAAELGAADPLWTKAALLADGSCAVRSFQVGASAWTLGYRPGTPDGFSGSPDTRPVCTMPPGSSDGTFDTDKDGIPDSDEVLGVLGFITAWWDPDTDGDKIWDRIEIDAVLNPLIPVEKEFPGCFPRGSEAVCKVIYAILCVVIDFDGDGFSSCGEGGDHPVTTEVVEFRQPSFAIYKFWPKVDGTYDLRLRSQQRTFVKPGTSPCTNVTVSAQADGVSVGSLTRPWVDSATPPWEEDVVATFNVSGINFNAVTAAMAVDVRLDVAFDPPSCATPLLAVMRSLAVDWLKVELAADRAEVNYKDADDVTSKSPDFLAAVLTEDMVITLDPLQKDMLLELDSMADHPWDGVVLNQVINAYSDDNIVLNFKVDETGLSHAGTDSMLDPGDLVGDDEASLYLADHRNPSLGAYLHVMNVHYLGQSSCDSGNFHYGSAENAGIGDDPEFSGVVLGDQCLIDTYSGVTTTVGQAYPDLTYRRVGNMLHEIGHAMDAAHDTSAGTVDAVIDGLADTTNCFNIMSRTASCDGFTNRMLGTGKFDRRWGATQPIGFPRWSRESTGQFDLTNLLSIHAGYNYDLLGLFT